MYKSTKDLADVMDITSKNRKVFNCVVFDESMQSEDGVITTEVEIIKYNEEPSHFYENIKVEPASADNDTESHIQNKLSFCKVEPASYYIVDSEDTDATICKLCNQSFPKYSDLLKHDCPIDKKLPKPSPKRQNPKELHKCEICSKTFKLVGHLKRHLVTHTGQKKYLCKICQRPFSDTSTMRKHMKIHSGRKDFECGICERRFSQNNHLKTHLLIHSGEKEFKCDYCGKSFRHGNNYRTHVRIHTGERPYYCESCDLAFNDGSCFRRHLKRRVHKRKL